ncbi:hypothetical protein PAF17_01340 [Paracoccus sp. Z330]|uniref:DUF4239 domain-containing protein n=1 Tax=Paracoccus onchidii TaxID=3017813 RepID=A0ABT4ZA38_9RHOB|nr:hypothetical protein [Paracoccus onchidii]MDB6176149.1 hypothetical protein [Paracoccus onchidii]
MQPLISTIIENRLLLILSCFVIGLIGMVLVLRNTRNRLWWRIADLVWVALGGLGVVTALLAGVYADDSARLERQIDLSYATSDAFDRDAARFRLRYCVDADNPAISRLCERIEFLSASAAINTELPFFADVAHASAPLRMLRPLIGEPETDGQAASYAEKLSRVERFDARNLLAFDPLDTDTVMALKSVERASAEIAADYRVLALTYRDLIESLRRVKLDWEFLQKNSLFVLFQVLALSLIAIAAPFRLGKSIAELC